MRSLRVKCDMKITNFEVFFGSNPNQECQFSLALLRDVKGLRSLGGVSELFKRQDKTYYHSEKFSLKSPIYAKKNDMIGFYFWDAGCVTYKQTKDPEDRIEFTQINTYYWNLSVAHSEFRRYSVKLSGMCEPQPQLPTVLPPPITIGDDLIQRKFSHGGGNKWVILQNKKINCNMRITEFGTYNTALGPIHLAVYRPVGPLFQLVATSEPVHPTIVGVNKFTLKASIDTQPGDVLGLFFPNAILNPQYESSVSLDWTSNKQDETSFSGFNNGYPNPVSNMVYMSKFSLQASGICL